MRIWPDVVLPAARRALLPGRLSASGSHASRPSPRCREWRPQFPLDLSGVLAPLRRGRGDPTWRSAGEGAAIWRVGTTPDGPATTRLHRRGDGTVVWHGLGAGRGVVARRAARRCSAPATDPEEFVAHHPLVADAARRHARAAASARPAGCGTCWCRPCWSRRSPAPRRGGRGGSCAGASATPAPGPAAGDGMRVPPTPAQIRAVPDWEWHRAGVDNARRRAILACAAVAHRLETALRAGRRARPGAAAAGARDRRLDRRRGGPAGLGRPRRRQLRRLPHPDARRAGRCWAARSTTPGCCRCSRPTRRSASAPCATSRSSGFRRPRFGPRFSPRDYRAI